ncbi:MAG: flagellar biosynthetic protein FliO [Gammaproteobacteria bacterium]|nr:flagellar biosynthetic protein FliO [Gammaproteobacteria bacterium]
MTSRFFYNHTSGLKDRLLYLATGISLPLLLSFIFFFCFSSPVFAIDSLVNPSVPSAAPDVTSSLIKVTVGLGLVIVAIFASAWFYRRFGNFSPVANDSLKVIGGLTMGQKEKIVLLQVGEEQVLIGVAPGNIQKLHVLEKPIKLNDEDSKETKAFADQLGDALGKWKNK